MECVIIATEWTFGIMLVLICIAIISDVADDFWAVLQMILAIVVLAYLFSYCF